MTDITTRLAFEADQCKLDGAGYIAQLLDDARAELERMQSNCDNAAVEIADLRAEIKALRQAHEIAQCKCIACGVAATNPDALLTTTGAYHEKWDSPQAEAVRELRADRDALRAELAATQVSDRINAANCDALRADAERHRWRMQNPTWGVTYRIRPGHPKEYRMTDEGEPWGQWLPSADAAIDAAIDAARSKA